MQASSKMGGRKKWNTFVHVHFSADCVKSVVHLERSLSQVMVFLHQSFTFLAMPLFNCLDVMS